MPREGYQMMQVEAEVLEQELERRALSRAPPTGVEYIQVTGVLYRALGRQGYLRGYGRWPRGYSGGKGGMLVMKGVRAGWSACMKGRGGGGGR